MSTHYLLKFKYLFYIILVWVISILSFSKQNSISYEIIYDYKEAINSNVSIDDNIEMIMVDGDGDTTRSNIKNKIDKNLFDITFQIITCGNDGGSVVKIDYSNSSNGLQMELKTPDKLVLQNNKWYSYSGNHVKAIPEIFYYAVESDSFKVILGYRCQKFSITETESGNKFDVWATKDLPNTLMPGAGYKPFPGAVLEMDFPERKAKFIAQKIKTL
jgi:hypothetical protein